MFFRILKKDLKRKKDHEHNPVCLYTSGNDVCVERS